MQVYGKLHGGEARDLKLEIPRISPTVRICISLIFSLIMVEADRVEKVKQLLIL